MPGTVTSETELIRTYLAPLTRGFAGAFDLTDDAALISVAEGFDLVVTSDPIIAGVHFFPTDRADDIAWKALAVNVSDLVAKGAEPLAYILTLAFPEPPSHDWMATFASGLDSAQREFGCSLAGGDTDRTRGVLSIGITAFGRVPKGAFVRRQGVRAGDHVYVTGTIGDSALGLDERSGRLRKESALTEGELSFLAGRYLRPNPRIGLTHALRACARAALDISDGLIKDLRRLAGASGITVPFEQIPLSPPAAKLVAGDASMVERIVAGGDDYEVLVAVAGEDAVAFEDAAAAAGVMVTNLGVLSEGCDVTILGPDGVPIRPSSPGYDHFSSPRPGHGSDAGSGGESGA